MEFALHHFSRFSHSARRDLPGTVQIKGSEGSPEDQRDPWNGKSLGKSSGNVMDKKASDCRCFLFLPPSFAEQKLLTFVNFLIEGSLEVKLPTIWTVEKQRWEESEEKRSEERRCRCAKGRNVVKHWKSRFTVFFQWFVAPEGRKVGSLKRRVRRHLARWEMKKCTPLWREAHFQVKMYKTHHSRTTFWSCDVEKVHAVVARSTFPSQNVQNTPGSDHFWKLRCRKSARRCGAKHIFKSKVLKTDGLGPLLEVPMSKKCRKSVHAVVARSTFRSQKCKKLRVLSLFWREDVEKVDTD